jgi:hypothetical protein
VSAAPLAGGLEKTQGRRHMSTTLLMSWKKTQGRRDICDIADVRCCDAAINCGDFGTRTQ